MDEWNHGWIDPREFESQSFYGEAYQQWEPYTESPMPFYTNTCALCGSPQHSPLECPLRFDFPEFMQEYEYEVSMHEETMASQAYPQEDEQHEPLRSLLLEAIAEMKASNARREEEIDQLNLRFALEQPPSITLQEPQSFLNQVKSTSNEEVHIDHYEQEFSIQVQYDDVNVQEEPLGYGKINASIEDFEQFWKARGHVVEESLEEEDEDNHVLFDEEDATMEVIYDEPPPARLRLKKRKVLLCLVMKKKLKNQGFPSFHHPRSTIMSLPKSKKED